MKLIRFGAPGKESPGLLQNDGIVDLGSLFPGIPDIGPSFFSNGWLERLTGVDAPGRRLNARLGSPLAATSKIICLGKNYREHAREGGMKIPSEPLLFCKTPNALNGPYDPVIMPHSSDQIDWEVELAVIIGRQGKAIAEADALNHVAGVSVMNDVSARRAQFGDKQWFRGKSFDTFAPLGPALVTLDEFIDIQQLRLTTKVNDQTMQDDTTASMIFDVASLIAYISQDITLMPGDIISTGTPSGVGIFQNPPKVLQAGDEVRCWIQGIGAIRNRFLDPDQAVQVSEHLVLPIKADLNGNLP